MARVPEKGAMDLPEEVAAYDRVSKRFLGMVEEKFVRRMARLMAGNKRPDRPFVLDLGTGTANIPIRLLELVPTDFFVALDRSLNMLEQARSNLREKGLQGRIVLVCADAVQLPFRDESFDLVYSHSTIHHFPDPLPAVSEIVRATRKGGQFMIRDLRRPPSWLLEAYVRVFGWSYDSLMRKMYRESLRAAFNYKEMKEMAGKIAESSVKARRFFITHVSLEGTREADDLTNF